MSKQEQLKKITFFTPSLQRTGSEIVLFNLLPYICESYSVTVITKYKGVLYDMLPKEVQKVYLYEKPVGRSIASRAFFKWRQKFITPKILKKHIHSFWYINTMVLPEILEYAKQHKIETCVHIHELEQMYSILSEEEIKTLTHFPKFIIANSHSSANVIKKFGSKLNTEIIYPAIDTSFIKADPEKHKLYRNNLKIHESDFLWLMCGTLDHNKNPFLFIEIAKELKQKNGHVKMMWIGGESGNSNYIQVCKEYAKKLAVDDMILWAGDVKKEDFYNYFNCGNGFVLTSNFESFSLVTIEAMLLGLPVVTQDCGGVTEILADKFGVVVKEKNNPVKLANEMLAVMDGTKEQNLLEQKQRAKEFDISSWGVKWKNTLDKHIQS